MWRKFVVLKVTISKIQEIRFYLTFGFLGFKFIKKPTKNLFKGSEDFGFFNFLSGWTKKYKPASNKSDSPWNNLYCVRLVIVSLAVNIGKLQSVVNEDTFFLLSV